MKNTTVDTSEVAKFNQLASQWWDVDGPLKTLHDINDVRLSFIQQYIDLKGARILDVGCGGGILTESMAALGAKVTGLDVEQDSIAAARVHSENSGLDIKYICQPIESFKEKAFDSITCMEMLEHVVDPELVIKHCARLLKPGGYLFLSTINRTVTAYATAVVAAEYILKLLPRQTHDFDKFIKPSELASMTRAKNLETITLTGMGYNPLIRKAYLQDSVAVNYLFACRRT